jgi:3-hydroxyisobutyrate dehydrogenase-like beta-hydroxyacid dehydrogenase
MNKNIGFIGLGSLGTPIALNLLAGGHRIYVYNRTSSKTKPLVEKGAIACESVAELAANCNRVCTIVSDDAALRSVAGQGLFDFMKPGSVHISMSTILPKTASEIAFIHQEHHQQYLSAPVFGRPEAAEAKKLNFVISGQPSIRLSSEPLLRDAGAAAIWDFGDEISAANSVKLCGNFLIAAALEAIGESIALAEKSGVDPKKMWEMLGKTLFNTPLYQNYSGIILEEKYKPAAFTAQLGLKDLKLVLEQASTVGEALPLGELLKSHLEELVRTGNNDLDWSAVSKGRLSIITES